MCFKVSSVLKSVEQHALSNVICRFLKYCPTAFDSATPLGVRGESHQPWILCFDWTAFVHVGQETIFTHPLPLWDLWRVHRSLVWDRNVRLHIRIRRWCSCWIFAFFSLWMARLDWRSEKSWSMHHDQDRLGVIFFHDRSNRFSTRSSTCFGVSPPNWT